MKAVIVRILSLTFLLAGIACSSNTPSGTLDEPSDTSDATDSSDASDVSGESDAAATADPSDSTDASDASDGADSSDATDASDPSDVTDSSDQSDGSAPVEPEPSILRFVVLGDGGEGNDAQYQVADTMRTLCDERGGCSFALYLGDNIYDDGIDTDEGLQDPQFEDKFELPYAPLDFPFYVVLGNHDYGLVPISNDKAEIQVVYSDFSQKWTMPDYYYTFEQDNAQFFGLDTNALMLDTDFVGDPSSQREWLDASLAASNFQWKIAFGHHPYLSNGQHGNAGNYEGIPEWTPGAGFVRGDAVKEFVEESMCGKIDIYFCGHDHNRQWLEPTCGTEFVVSGAAAKLTDLEGRGSPTFYEDDLQPGFMLVEIQDNRLRGEFYDQYGNLDFFREVIK